VDADGVQAPTGEAEESANIENIGRDDNAAGRRLGAGPRR
jgi:hypothetical protein